MITRYPDIRRRQAFTLAELTVVAVVLGVLSMIAIPRLGNTVERMRVEEGKQMLLAIYAAQKRYWQENGQTYTDNFDDLDIDIRPSAKFENIQLDASGYPLAQMDRTNGAYTLTINEMGQVYCMGTICYELGLY
ncbi:MAG: prepilin-type N-terminal cleavage/methylation domain-containing protein [Candidatus Omnitrophota bacterium]|jgi:prepilin-type N-terminal cleavage/methylation domain-containing protein